MFRLILICYCAIFAAADAAEVVGFVYVNGPYRVDGAPVRGNATVFEGATIETDAAPAKLQLEGTRVWLTPGSKIKVSSHDALLLSGMGQMQATGTFALRAGPVTVTGSGPDSIVRVRLDGGSTAVVMPLQGAADVRNLRGDAVGNIDAGQSVQFAAHPGAATAVQGSGCLRRRGDDFAIVDGVTHMTLHLKGSGLESEVGQIVNVRGTREISPPESRAQTVRVSSVQRVGPGACTTASAPILTASLQQPAAPETPAAKPIALNIVIVEGEGAINNIRQRTAREPIVEVQDENHRPVAGALVLFALPRSGPGGVFPNGATTLSVTTDQQGRAVARGLKPNRHEGQYQVTVTASYAGATATAVISQANVLAVAVTAAGTGAATAGAIGLATKVAIISGVAASGTVGGLAASGAFSGGSAEVPASR